MNRSLLCLWMAVIIASSAILIATSNRASRAHAASKQARAELRTISQQAAELTSLRESRTDFPERPAGDSALASRISAAMARAGLVSNILQSLSPEARSPSAGDSRLTRQRATLTLANLSLPQVGKFLDAWRTAEPDWIVSAIDLIPMTSTRDTPSIGTDLPLRAVITIEGVFKDPAPKSAATPLPTLGASR
ncbi:MAG: hypothetical protein KF678_15145 [Phycisphaeraceae bacterium]|nr:hypothetical protein [Phycisphaeraceae bacterium]